MARVRLRGAKYLLQGLTVCQYCRYAYYGKPVRNKRGQKIDSYAYYRCIGTDGYRFGGKKVCHNKQIRTDVLDTAVWEEVKFLLRNPTRIFDEYQSRIIELKESPLDQAKESLEKQENKLKRGINRLIDSYAQEHLEKNEFEPRIKVMKRHLKMIEEQKKEITNKQNLQRELTLIVTNLKEFASDIESKLEVVDWQTKRSIIRALVKRVEIAEDGVNVVFRVQDLTDSTDALQGESQKSLQDCNRGTVAPAGEYLLALCTR